MMIYQNEANVEGVCQHMARCISRERERECTTSLLDCSSLNEAADTITEVDTLGWLAAFTGDSVQSPSPTYNTTEEVTPRTHKDRRARLRHVVSADRNRVVFQHHNDFGEYMREYRKRCVAAVQFDNCSQCNICYQYSLTTARRELKKRGLIGCKPAPASQDWDDIVTSENRHTGKTETISQPSGKATSKIIKNNRSTTTKVIYKYHKSAWQPELESSQQESESEQTCTSSTESGSTRADSDTCKYRRNVISLQFSQPKSYKPTDRISYEVNGRNRKIQYSATRFNDGIQGYLRGSNVSPRPTKDYDHYKQATVSERQVSHQQRMLRSPSKLASNCYQDLVSFRNTFRKYYLRTSSFNMSRDSSAARRKQRIANLCKQQVSRVFPDVRSCSEMTNTKNDSTKIIDEDEDDGSIPHTESNSQACDEASKSTKNKSVNSVLRTQISSPVFSMPVHVQRMYSPHIDQPAAFPKLFISS